MPTGPSWHVIRTKFGFEARAVRALAGVLDGAFTPMHRTSDRLVPLWSSYAFGKWVTEDPYAWHRARRAIGVFQILHASGEEMPMPVHPADLVDGWLAIADADGIVPGLEPPKITKRYDELVSKRVALREGMTGIVLRIDDRSWAIVRAEMFGRAHDVAVPAEGLVVVEDDGGRLRRRHNSFLRRDRRERRRIMPASRDVSARVARLNAQAMKLAAD